MNKQDLMNLNKEEVVEEYMKLENRLYYLISKNAVLEARLEIEHNMCEMLKEKDRVKTLKKKL